ELPTTKKDTSGIARDKELVAMSGTIIRVLKAQPEAFHGTMGLFLLTTLDDASRNAALCANTGTLDIVKGLLEPPKANEATRILATVQRCQKTVAVRLSSGNSDSSTK
ncbi:MAG TPA: hypothetical protein VH088_08980, partial [Terriglobales bacterium]|nr:hypothetical protein [Terriglobales bacterium]